MTDSDSPAPGFFERVVDVAPTPLLVVDGQGVVVYGNELMRRLAGWSLEEGVGKSIFEAIHPDDIELIANAFGDLTGDEPDPDWADRPWAPINFRMVDRWGGSIPVEVTGRTMLDDPGVGAIVYEVRPARERELFQRVITGIASDGALSDQLGLIVDLIDATAIAIDSAVVQRDPDGGREAIAASGPDLASLVGAAASAGEPLIVEGAAVDPVFVDVAGIPGAFGSGLRALGYRDAWFIDTFGGLEGAESDGCRIVAFTEQHHASALGVIDRVRRAAELASFLVVRERSRRRLERAAHHDPLTGLPNRLGLEQRFEGDRRAAGAGPGDPTELTMLFVDLDGFKTVNDLHGHEIGDLVLRTVAERLQGATRAGDLVARFGGDEFAIVLGRPVGESAVVDDVVERVIAAVAKPIIVGGAEHQLTASVGTIDATSSADLAAVLAAADRAMYEAKRAGGDRVHRGSLAPD